MLKNEIKEWAGLTIADFLVYASIACLIIMNYVKSNIANASLIIIGGLLCILACIKGMKKDSALSKTTNFIKKVSYPAWLIIFFVISFFLNTNLFAGSWVNFKSDEGSFSIQFPKSPKQNSQSYETDQGLITLNNFSITENDASYIVSYTDYPETIVQNLSPKELLDSTADDTRSKEYMKIEYIRPLQYAGTLSQEMKVLDTRKPQTIFVIRCYYKAGRLWSTILTIPAAQFSVEHANRYLDSFQIIQHN